MKRLVFLFLLLFVACGKSTDNFQKYNWSTEYYFSGDNWADSQVIHKTMFRNDSMIQYSNPNDHGTAFPIKKSDEFLLVKRNIEITNDNVKKDTIVIDTFQYDFKNILGKPTLILKGVGMWRGYFKVLNCENCDKEIDTTSFLMRNITSFKIGGIGIGDALDDDRIAIIEDLDNYLDKGLVSASLEDNKNLKVKLINKNMVYSIEQQMIDEDGINKIVDVVKSKTTITLDTIKKEPPFYEEGFRWDSDELKIRLSKKDMSQYYLDRMGELKNEYSGLALLAMKRAYSKELMESYGSDKFWILTYDNIILQSVLKFDQKEEVSTIIE